MTDSESCQCFVLRILGSLANNHWQAASIRPGEMKLTPCRQVSPSNRSIAHSSCSKAAANDSDRATSCSPTTGKPAQESRPGLVTCAVCTRAQGPKQPGTGRGRAGKGDPVFGLCTRPRAGRGQQVPWRETGWASGPRQS
jgi:hypothetical protein